MIPAFGKGRQADHEFKDSLGNIVITLSQNNNKTFIQLLEKEDQNLYMHGSNLCPSWQK
jgi:succinate dehydrogenase flavin-adding protein (antitoxin of CptAB toxin-antitoxin module)